MQSPGYNGRHVGESRSFPAPSTWSWVLWNLPVLLQSREKHESQREMSLKEVAWPRSHPACGAIGLQPRGFQTSDSCATRSDGPSMLPMQAGRWDKTEPSSTSQGTVPAVLTPKRPSDTEAVHLGAFDFPPCLGHRGGRFPRLTVKNIIVGKGQGLQDSGGGPPVGLRSNSQGS